VWGSACSHLAATLSPDVYDRWIRVIEATEIKGDTLFLRVANDFYQSWLEENYLPLIRNAIAVSCGRDLKIEFGVGAVSTPAEPPAPAEPAAEPARTERHGVRRDPGLNPKYIFESFVVGASNSFAHACALAVAQSPGRSYNPLFIYGGVGLGKTHLMQAIGHQVHRQGKTQICYTSCETFLNDYIEGLQSKSLAPFRKKYRDIDLLLIDDIHFLAGKERIQEEFFHTFNALYEKQKQIVLTSDRPAREITGLEQRLVSRFEWGTVTQIELPDIETRIAILRKKQQDIRLSLPDDVITFIAEHIRSNIRRLEGALIRVASYASLTGKPLNTDTVEYLLNDTIDQEQHEALTIEAVQRVVAEFYDIRLGDMPSKQRPQSIAFPRQVAMYLCRTLTSNSLPTIGNAFGRNHATVLHACRLVGEKIKTDAAFRQTIGTIRQRLGQRTPA